MIPVWLEWLMESASDSPWSGGTGGVTTSLIGVRAWMWDYECDEILPPVFGLLPRFNDPPWVTPKAVAACISGCNSPPNEMCECGIYALLKGGKVSYLVHFLETESSVFPYLFGLVRLWGRAMVGELGVRAQFAEALGVVLPDDVSPWELPKPWRRVPSLTRSEATQLRASGVSAEEWLIYES